MQINVPHLNGSFDMPEGMQRPQQNQFIQQKLAELREQQNPHSASPGGGLGGAIKSVLQSKRDSTPSLGIKRGLLPEDVAAMNGIAQNKQALQQRQEISKQQLAISQQNANSHRLQTEQNGELHKLRMGEYLRKANEKPADKTQLITGRDGSVKLYNFTTGGLTGVIDGQAQERKQDLRVAPNGVMVDYNDPANLGKSFKPTGGKASTPTTHTGPNGNKFIWNGHDFVPAPGMGRKEVSSDGPTPLSRQNIIDMAEKQTTAAAIAAITEARQAEEKKEKLQNAEFVLKGPAEIRSEVEKTLGFVQGHANQQLLQSALLQYGLTDWYNSERSSNIGRIALDPYAEIDFSGPGPEDESVERFIGGQSVGVMPARIKGAN